MQTAIEILKEEAVKHIVATEKTNRKDALKNFDKVMAEDPHLMAPFLSAMKRYAQVVAQDSLNRAAEPIAAHGQAAVRETLIITP